MCLIFNLPEIIDTTEAIKATNNYTKNPSLLIRGTVDSLIIAQIMKVGSIELFDVCAEQIVCNPGIGKLLILCAFSSVREIR